jgi:hypothetical protein
MKIYSVFVPQYVEVDTSIGTFNVYQDGSIVKWVDYEENGQGFYQDICESDYEAADLKTIRDAAGLWAIK